MRLIDADALMEVIGRQNQSAVSAEYVKGIAFCAEKIMHAPTIEPAEQVTSKLNNPCGSLLTGDSDADKEHERKLEPSVELISREDAVKAVEKEGCLGYIECKADKIYDRINALPTADAVSREEYDALRRDYNKLYEATKGLCDKILGNEETEGPDHE